MSIENLLQDVSTAVNARRGAIQHHSKILLKDVFQRVSTLRQAKRRFADELAPDFHFFDYLRSDEFGLSRCLADLLDPTFGDGYGKHGQAGLFLDTLVAHLSRNENTKSITQWATAENCESVTLEQLTEHGRRIDIVIRFRGGGLLALENKPWAGDQINQLNDYADYLAAQSTKNQWLLVYLSNREPDKASIDDNRREELEASGNFLRFSFRNAEAWLQEASEKTRAVKVRLFVEDLIQFVRTQVRGDADMSETLEVTQQILSTKESLESSFLISKSLQHVKNNLLERFEVCLENLMTENGFFLEIDLNSLKSGEVYTGFSIWFSKASENRAHLCFEFGRSNLNSLCWGIALHKDKATTETRLQIHEIMTKGFGDGKQNGGWPWWQPIDKQWGLAFVNWYDSEKPWLAIYDCEDQHSLPNRILDLAKRTESAFNSRMDLLQNSSFTGD